MEESNLKGLKASACGGLAGIIICEGAGLLGQDTSLRAHFIRDAAAYSIGAATVGMYVMWQYWNLTSASKKNHMYSDVTLMAANFTLPMCASFYALSL